MTLKTLTELHKNVNNLPDNDSTSSGKYSIKASAPGNGNEIEGGSVRATISGGLIREAGAVNRLAAPIQYPLLDTNFPNGLYLDVGDNVQAKVEDSTDDDWLENNCGESSSQWFIPGHCENMDFKVGKVISCGKEWCPNCSKLGSPAHGRRYVRGLEYIRQFKRMRYIIFTIPKELRGQYRTKESLTELGRKCQALLKKHGFKRGLRRWHYFGDKSTKWHPHLNVLVEGGYLNRATIDAIRRDYWKIIGYTGKPVANPKFTYKRRPADMAGSLHYVTRATFHDYNWDKEVALEIRNFRNMVVWGKTVWMKDEDGNRIERLSWGGIPWLYQWEPDKNERFEEETGLIGRDGQPEKVRIDVDKIDKIINGICPKCGGKIKWGDALPARILKYGDGRSLGAGFYEVFDKAHRAPPTEENESFLLTVRRKCTELEKGNYNHSFDLFRKRHRKQAELWKKKYRERQEIEALWDEILEKGAKTKNAVQKHEDKRSGLVPSEGTQATMDAPGLA